MRLRFSGLEHIVPKPQKRRESFCSRSAEIARTHQSHADCKSSTSSRFERLSKCRATVLCAPKSLAATAMRIITLGSSQEANPRSVALRRNHRCRPSAFSSSFSAVCVPAGVSGSVHEDNDNQNTLPNGDNETEIQGCGQKTTKR